MEMGRGRAEEGSVDIGEKIGGEFIYLLNRQQT